MYSYIRKTELGNITSLLFIYNNKVVHKQIFPERLGVGRLAQRVVMRTGIYVYHLDPFRVVYKEPTRSGWKTTYFGNSGTFYRGHWEAGCGNRPDAVGFLQSLLESIVLTSDERARLLAPNIVELVEREGSWPLREYIPMLKASTRPIWSGRLKEGAKKVYGNSGKQVMKLIHDLKLTPLNCLVLLKGLVPFDKAIEIATDHNVVGLSRSFIYNLKPSLRLRLKNDDDARLARDTYNMIGHLSAKRRKEFRKLMHEHQDSIKDLHDFAILFYTKYRKKGKEHRPYPSTPLIEVAKKLITTPEGWELRLPKKPLDVHEWGSEMGHCIGSYASAHGHRCILMGLYKDGELVTNLMFNETGILVQHYGKYNRLPTKEEVRAVSMTKYAILSDLQRRAHLEHIGEDPFGGL